MTPATRIIARVGRTCPDCGEPVTESLIDHKRGQIVMWPCRHVWDLSDLDIP